MTQDNGKSNIKTKFQISAVSQSEFNRTT